MKFEDGVWVCRMGELLLSPVECERSMPNRFMPNGFICADDEPCDARRAVISWVEGEKDD